MSGGAKQSRPRDKNSAMSAERYRVTESVHFIAGRLVNPGEIVSLPEGVKPGDKLVEVDDAGNPVVKKAAEIAKTEQAKTDAKADEKPKQ